MQPRYLGLFLAAVVVAGGLLLVWSQTPPRLAGVDREMPAAPPENELDSVAPVLASLEQGIARLSEQVRRLEERDLGETKDQTPAIDDLNRRLEALEAHLARQPQAVEEEEIGSRYEASSERHYPGSVDPRISEVQLAYESDTRIGAGRQWETENVNAIFDKEALSGLEFRQIDCTDHYCRLTYDDNRGQGGAMSPMAENELALSLGQEFGFNIKIHGGPREGNSRTLFIELGTR